MSTNPRKIHASFNIDADLDPESSAATLREIADAMAELHEAARAVLRASGRDDVLDRADAYWLDRFMEPNAEDGCDGIYGTVRELESDEDEDE